MSKQEWIQQLSLLPHPEGGYYREVFRGNDVISSGDNRYSGPRNNITSIYFLLGSEDRSVFHRLKSDEIWYYHAGCSATLHLLDADGNYRKEIIGPEGQLQVIITRDQWFGATVNTPDSYILVSCAVAPGFDFSDFEMASREELLASYSQHEEIIKRLT